MDDAYNAWLLREDSINLILKRKIQEISEAIQREPDSFDALLDVLILSLRDNVEEYLTDEYERSWDETLGDWLSLKPSDPDMIETVWRDIDGLDFSDRISEYVAQFGTDLNVQMLENRLALLVASDGHRVRTEAALSAGNELDSVGFIVTKTWRGVMDEKERDAHVALEGITLPLDGYFEVNGARALGPGLFFDPTLDCGCRCILDIKVTGE